MDDLELIEQVRSGRTEAFAELVRKYQSRVYGFCVSMLTNLDEADDAAQEIFVKVFRSLNSFRGASSFSTWLYQISSHHCHDLLRKRYRRPTESWDDLVEQRGELPEELISRPAGGEKAAEAADLIRRALPALPPEYRTILILREVQGLSYSELAETLHCSLDAVKARLRRAREALEEKVRHILRKDNV